MNLREKREELEHLILKPYASFADRTKRKKEEEKDLIRTEYQRDRDTVTHLRELKQKANNR